MNLRTILKAAALVGAALAAAPVLLIALTGLLTAAGAAQRANAIDSLVNESEPRASAAQQLYLALSEADATASRAFLSGGLEPPEVRQRYDDAIARAGTALAVSSSGASDDATPARRPPGRCRARGPVRRPHRMPGPPQPDRCGSSSARRRPTCRPRAAATASSPWPPR